MPVAVSFGVAALGWLASPVIKDLFEKSKAYLDRDISKGLKDLDTTILPQLQLTIKAAKKIDLETGDAHGLKKWLERLKIAYYDVEAILHDLEYDRLQLQLESAEKKKQTLPKFTRKMRDLFLKKEKGTSEEEIMSDKKISFSKKNKLWEQLINLKKVAAEAKTFRELLGIQTACENDASATGGYPNGPTALALPDRVVGRDKVRDQIIDFLLGNHEANSSISNRHSVVAITGGGGDGKTTLAQYIYIDQRVKEHFDGKMMWLSLCHQTNIDIKELTKDMIECVSKQCPNLSTSATTLQELLINALMSDSKEFSNSKPVLLVLDDVWYDKESKVEQFWNTLLAPLINFLRGRLKIIITSRSSSFPQALRPGKCILLRDMEYDNFKDLFMHHALHGLESNIEVNNLNQLRDIGNQIAKKMIRSPLAARVIGNQLREHLNIRFWLDTLENTNVSDITEVLRWSYERLDAQLQRCFLYFAVYPKGYPYSVPHLVQQWVALDFIQPSHDKTKSVEDIGMEYFGKMKDNSIIQQVNRLYTVHDLYHDLAEKLFAGDFFRVTYSDKAIQEAKITTLHMYFFVDGEDLKEKLRSIPELSNLRSLELGCLLDEDMSEIFSMISTKFKNLRVLTIRSRRSIGAIPTSIGDMRNLRCLRVYVRSLELKELPNSVSRLYHLQFLILNESVKTLPTKLSNLIKLRRIMMYDDKISRIHTLPPVPHLGKLTSLQYLPEFHVKKEKGYEVGQLGGLREIRGSLRIVDVENIRDKNEAIEAKLEDKSKLEELELVWGESTESSPEVEVIEALRPPKNLGMLKIYGYRGSNYPTWLQDGSLLENLTTLRIFYCPSLILVRENELQMDINQLEAIMGQRQFSRFPKISEALQNIFHYEIKSFEKTGSLQNCPEQLEIIKNADLLHQLWSNVMPAWWICHQQRMKFIFSSNNGTKSLELPSRLRVLDLRGVCISDEALSNILQGMAALEQLHLYDIMTITVFPPEQVLQSLERLRVLNIKQCFCLRSLGGLHALPRLQIFEVVACLLLETTGARLPPSLQSFFIRGCELHEDILRDNLPCLENVTIVDCNVSFSLSFGQLTSLKLLHLMSCPNLSVIQDLESRPFIDTLAVQRTNLDETPVQCYGGCRHLAVSSSVMLNKLLSFEVFLSPQIVEINKCEEEAIKFEESAHLRSIKTLRFTACKTKNLPKSLSGFSALEYIDFRYCSQISELPELSDSVKSIKIIDCPILKERCQPNGLDWHKIQRIQYRQIE